MKIGDRYKVVLWHGESRSVWYIVDTFSDDKPCVVASGTVR